MGCHQVYLGTLKSDFHIIFTFHEISIRLPSFKNVKTIFSRWGRVWPTGYGLPTPVHRKWNRNHFQGMDGIASYTKERSCPGDRLNSLAIFVWQCRRGKTFLSLEVNSFSDKASESLLLALISWGMGWVEGGEKQVSNFAGSGQQATQEEKGLSRLFVLPESLRWHTVPPSLPMSFSVPVSGQTLLQWQKSSAGFGNEDEMQKRKHPLEKLNLQGSLLPVSLKSLWRELEMAT